MMGMIKNSQSTQSNIFAISSQYLKEEVRDGVHFLHADKHQSLHKLALSFLMEVARHIQSTQNRKLILFLQQKTDATVFVFYCDPNHLDILEGSSQVCCYLSCFFLMTGYGI